MPEPALVVAAIAAAASAAMHVVVFVTESVAFTHPRSLAMLEVEPADAGAVRLWAYHQGVYNLLFALMSLAGAAALLAGAETAGATLLVAVSASMIAAALALLAVDRRRERLPGFAAQALPAAVVLGAVVLGAPLVG